MVVSFFLWRVARLLAVAMLLTAIPHSQTLEFFWLSVSALNKLHAQSVVSN